DYAAGFRKYGIDVPNMRVEEAAQRWFVDATPWDDSEFSSWHGFQIRPTNQGEQNRMDLLTVLDHELGHVLGFEHANSGVMLDTLAAGTRRTPASATSWVDSSAVDWLAPVMALEHRKLFQECLG